MFRFFAVVAEVGWKESWPCVSGGVGYRHIRVLPPIPDVLETVMPPDQTCCVCEEK